MGTMFVFGFGAAETHEGYAARKLPSGEVTGVWSTETDAFVAHVAACDCGWRGTEVHPPTAAGEEAAIEAWKTTHLCPLIPRLAREAARREARRVAEAFERAGVEGLDNEPMIKPLAALAAVGALRSSAAFRIEMAVSDARAVGATWGAIGDALGMSATSAEREFGP